MSHALKIDRVEVKLVAPDKRDKRGYLRAFVVIEVSCGDLQFVIRDIKVIAAPRGMLQLCMPSKLYDSHCPACRTSNILAAKYCNACGIELPMRSYRQREDGSTIRGYDTLFPINQDTRRFFESAIFEAYRKAEQQTGETSHVPNESNGVYDEPAATATAGTST